MACWTDRGVVGTVIRSPLELHNVEGWTLQDSFIALGVGEFRPGNGVWELARQKPCSSTACTCWQCCVVRTCSVRKISSPERSNGCKQYPLADCGHAMPANLSMFHTAVKGLLASTALVSSQVASFCTFQQSCSNVTRASNLTVHPGQIGDR